MFGNSKPKLDLKLYFAHLVLPLNAWTCLPLDSNWARFRSPLVDKHIEDFREVLNTGLDKKNVATKIIISRIMV